MISFSDVFLREPGENEGDLIITEQELAELAILECQFYTSYQ